MSKFLKGTYKLKRNVKRKTKKTKRNAFPEFESEAIKKLGGSIAFVNTGKLVWSGENEKRPE